MPSVHARFLYIDAKLTFSYACAEFIFFNLHRINLQRVYFITHDLSIYIPDLSQYADAA